MAEKKTKHVLARAVLREDREYAVGDTIELTKTEVENMSALGMLVTKDSQPAPKSEPEPPADEPEE